MVDLNPDQFFHGTSQNIAVGEKVLPAKAVGVTPNWKSRGVGNTSGARHAYASTSEEVSWRFAHTAIAEGRPRVYEVAPNPDSQLGLYHSEHPRYAKNQSREDLKEHVASHWDTVRQIDTKPGHQGTFPELNWNQFRGPKVSRYTDVNHPTPEDVTAGHMGSGMYHETLRKLYGDTDEVKRQIHDKATHEANNTPLPFPK